MQSILSPKKYIQTKGRLLPIHECHVNSDWQEAGLASIIISRQQPSGNFIVGIYLVDLYATGLKDTFYFFNQSESQYGELLKSSEEGMELDFCSYELAHNIIYEGISYAEQFGFTPHKDFEISKYIIEEDTEDIEEIDIECGLEGKPCVVVFPDDPKTKIIAQLERTAGKGNFSVIQPGEEEDLEDLEDLEEEDEEDEFDEEDEETDEDFAESARIIEALESNTAKSYEEAFGGTEEDELLDEGRLIPSVISDEQLPDTASLPIDEQEEVWELTDLTSIEPVSNYTIMRLKTKVKKFPNSPVFYELLSAAYRKNDQLKKSEDILKYAVDKLPDHLFTRLSYGNALIFNNKLDEFKNHFGGKVYLDEIAPGRTFFYRGEVFFFLQTMFAYFITTDAFHKADQIMLAMKKLGNDEEPGIDLIAMRLTVLAAKLKKMAEAGHQLPWADENIKATISSIK